MVRRIQQCGSCRRRFIEQSTQANEETPHCFQCQSRGPSKPGSDDEESPLATRNDSDGEESLFVHENSGNGASVSSEVEPLLPEAVDVDPDESSWDEDEDLPLAELIARHSGLKDTTNTPFSKEISINHKAEPGQASVPSPPKEGITAEPILDFEGVKVPEENKDLSMCNICGSLLMHISSWKGRLNHLKRCSQKHGVTAGQDLPEEQEENTPAQTLAPKPTSINQILMAGARRKAIHEKHKAQAAAKRPKSSAGSWYHRRAPSGACPEHKKIPGTDFVVDGFYYAKPSLTSNYFLTHFHSDHYGGLSKSWSAGIIYCSSVTANLVEQQLRVERKFIHVLPMNQTVALETRSGRMVKVTLLDANHCPGAVLFFFQVGEQTILHVGDFRWHRDMLSPIHSLLQDRRLDRIFLDTTYCDPKYTLPTQEAAIGAAVDFAVAQVQEAKRCHARLLLLFGAYTIGKERIYLAVAKALGMKVYVDSRRFRILQALEWPDEQRAMITKDSNETCIWVVPLGHISMKKLPSYTNVKIGRSEVSFDRVVGFRPTGWSLKTGKAKPTNHTHSELLTVCKRGSLTTCSVPYSEHSSFNELVDCLACLQPRIIVPTVSVQKSQAQINLLLEHFENT